MTNPYTLRRLQYESTKAKLLEREFHEELRVSIELVEALTTELSQSAREGEFA